MPRSTAEFVPTYRRHKGSGQAVVTIDGRDHYLGAHGSAASKKEYDRLVAEWLAGGRTLPNDAGRTVNEVILAHVRFAVAYYGGSEEVEKIKLAARPLKELYGRIEAAEFSPLKLKAVRQKLIDAGLGQRTINMRIGCLKRMFRWAVENELVPPAVYQGLAAVTGLKRGRSEAKPPKVVTPVPEAFVDAVVSRVNRHLAAMIQLQRLTGARSGEVVIMRASDIDMTGKIWIYRPHKHKNDYRGQSREIYLGPQAQEIIRPFLNMDLSSYLFSPKAAREERYAALRAVRKSKVQPSQVNRQSKRPKKVPGLRYTPRSYRRAIIDACKVADIPPWHPHQLRHLAATKLRKEFGLETSRIILGHKSVMATQIYAEADKAAAMEVIGRVG